MKILAKFGTDGKGFWSLRKVSTRNNKGIPIINMDVTISSDNESQWGSLRVFFDSKIWVVTRDGLIYTDKRWLKDLRKYLRTQGFSQRATNHVWYSEQGRQGRNYVDLDIGEKFIEELEPLLRFLNGKKNDLQITVTKDYII